MHRGSSKGPGGLDPGAEILPLSAPSEFRVELEIQRGSSSELRVVHVVPATQVRKALSAIGRAPEGCAVFFEGRSIPLDTPLEKDCRLLVIATFSGG